MKRKNANRSLEACRNRRSSIVIRHRAREMRRESTNAETLLWAQIRNHKQKGLKFRRQHPIGPFVVDFFCAEQQLIIELDGPIHAKRIEYDHMRTRYLEKRGYRVIRFNQEDVLGRTSHILIEIEKACTDLPERPNGRGKERDGSSSEDHRN